MTTLTKARAAKAVKDACFRELYEKAHRAGMAAAEACRPTPMMVVDADPLTGQPKPDAQRYVVDSGVCGFAWVSFKGNTAFGRWAKKNGATSNYPTGLRFWVSYFGQSLERKEAYARAFAEVLRAGGVTAYSHSRMD